MFEKYCLKRRMKPSHLHVLMIQKASLQMNAQTKKEGNHAFLTDYQPSVHKYGRLNTGKLVNRYHFIEESAQRNIEAATTNTIHESEFP